MVDSLTPDERKEARAYAWGYFALHADQRMKLFNFFLIFSGLILGAFPAVKSMAAGAKFVAIFPLLLVLTAFVFWQLDKRTRRLVKIGEDALRFLDQLWPVEPLSDQTPNYLRLIERDDHLMEPARRPWWAGPVVPISYAECFRFGYLIIGGVGVVLAAWVSLA